MRISIIRISLITVIVIFVIAIAISLYSLINILVVFNDLIMINTLELFLNITMSLYCTLAARIAARDGSFRLLLLTFILECVKDLF